MYTHDEILVVEDDEATRDLIVNSLNNLSITGHILDSGDPVEAINIYFEHRCCVKLVICDQHMPTADGDELCKVIKDNEPHCIIIMYTGDEEVNKENVDNVDIIIKKSKGIDALMSKVQACIEQIHSKAE